ncbi:MAG TPA: phosphatase PAP2 family protein [Gammaproteobacteria bacterium]|nr:phosphatase PAP2 family protein [Gammaproteobacteria bacterium]
MDWKGRLVVVLCLFCAFTGVAVAAGGPLGIDYRLSYDNSGIYKRSYQHDLIYAMVAGELGGALWFGGKSRLGRTFWQAVDSSALAAGSTFVLKRVFQRTRPEQENNPDPNKWFQGCCNNLSFPSGEVAGVTSIVTPFILEYHRQQPWIWGLELLPVYDAEARMKTWGHWQTDVLGGFVLGTFTGYLAHERKMPFLLSVLPHGFMVGLHERF